VIPREGEVLHFSEDPGIARFAPHVAATAQQPDPYVWAVDAARAPDYWFPRDCPRAMAWLTPATTERDRAEVLGPSAARVHVIEHGWLERLRTVRLYAYRLPADRFEPFGSPVPHAHVATEPIEPLGPAEPVGDLLALHAAAEIELRLAPSLWPFVERAAGSTAGYSGIRLGNARRP
jgi:hypothetical protein